MKKIMKRNWLYFKLTIRNAKRSYADYLLYIVTVSILLAVMEAAECVAMAGKNLAGFQTASLPALIVMILIILTSVIQDFMMRQREGVCRLFIAGNGEEGADSGVIR